MKLSSYAISSLLFLVTLTFFGFFFTDPLQYGTTALALAQYISQFAWVILIVIPPILLSLKSWTGFVKALFLVAVLAWPAMLIVIRVLLLVETGDPYLNYLMTYPLFIFTDILVPVIYVFIWRQRSGAVKGTGSRSIERAQQQESDALYAE